MDNRQSPSKQRSHVVRRSRSDSGTRPRRQPTRALIAALLWIVLMLVVWFQAPGIRLPTFFQRMVGVAHALLSMLVVLFAIREYGKRYNRMPVPLLGRISTSRVAGGFVFLAVLGWWASPWAPIPAGAPEPDLWRMLEQGLDTPLLQVVDTNLATLVPPAPSVESQQAAKAFATNTDPPRNADPLRSALVAIASGKFDDAQKLMNLVPVGPAAGQAEQARAQLDLYRGNFAAACLRYAEMLKVQPRREDFLAHGAMAAALAGNFSTALDWARQLLAQARARGRASVRSVEAANLLAVIQLLSGDYSEARQTSAETLNDAERKLGLCDATASTDIQDAAAANNAAVILLFAGSRETSDPSQPTDFANSSQDWINGRGSRSRGQPDPSVALERFNLGMTALQEARYDQAESLLTESLAMWRQVPIGQTRTCLAINLNALAQLDCIEGRYARAESRTHEAADLFAGASADDPSVLAFKATVAELDASQGRYDQAIVSLRELTQEAELGHRGLLPSHPYVAILKLRLADCLLRAGSHAAAEKTAEEASAILDHARLNTTRAAADALRIAGLAALRQGNREQSERQFDRAETLLHSTDESHPTQHASPELAALRAAQGDLAGDLQNYTEASDFYRQGLDQLTQLFGKQAIDHPLRAEYLQALAMLLVHEEKPTEAKPLLEESLAIDRRALPPNHPSTIAVMEDLAIVLEKTGSKDDAEKLRSQANQLRAQ